MPNCRRVVETERLYTAGDKGQSVTAGLATSGGGSITGVCEMMTAA